MNMSLIIRNFVMFLAMALLSANTHAELIASDGFEGSTWSGLWVDTTNVSLSSERAKDGEQASRWIYRAAAIDKDGWSEGRFDLGKAYEEVSIQFDIHIPSNYVHRDSEGPDNNKLFRLWNKTYNDEEKIGASMYNEGTTGESSVGSDYRKAAEKGMSSGKNSVGDFITMDDVGKWMKVVIYVKAATDSTPAQLKIYKNGKLHHKDTPPINHVPGTQGYRYGYLLGWSASGFTEDTVFYIDNLKFYDENIIVGPGKTSIECSHDPGPDDVKCPERDGAL